MIWDEAVIMRVLVSRLPCWYSRNTMMFMVMLQP